MCLARKLRLALQFISLWSEWRVLFLSISPLLLGLSPDYWLLVALWCGLSLLISRSFMVSPFLSKVFYRFLACIFWHFWQFWTYRLTSLLTLSYVQFSLILDKVFFIPGCPASLWSWFSLSISSILFLELFFFFRTTIAHLFLSTWWYYNVGGSFLLLLSWATYFREISVVTRKAQYYLSFWIIC